MSQIQPSRPSVDGLVVVPGLSFTQCGAINASQACTADITFASGHVLTSYPLVKGYNNIQATKADNISAGTLVGLYNEGIGEFVLPTPIALADIRNTAYSIKGVTKVLSDLWVENLAWGPHDPTTIVPGVGYKLTATALDTNDFLVSTPALFAALNIPSGVVMVVDYVLQAAPANDHDCEISFNASGGPNFIWDTQFGAPNTFISGDNSISYSDLRGRNRVAALLSTATLASSRNGSAAETVVGNSAAAADNIVLNLTVQGGATATSMIIEKITFYPPVTDHAVLAYLSA